MAHGTPGVDLPDRRKNQLPGAAWGLGTVVLLAAFVWLILQVQAVLSALIGSVLLASLLEPVAARLALGHVGRWTVGRRLASALVVVVFLAILGVTVWVLVPVLAAQAKVLISNIPAYLAKASEEYKVITRGLTILPDEMTAAFQKELANLLAELGRNLAQGALGLVSNIIGLLGLVVIPVGAFYVMSDGASIQTDFLAALPPGWREGARSLSHDISIALSGYVRGQTLVCLSSSVLYSVVFGVLGLPYFIVLGVMAGVAEAIPYLGSVIVTLAVLVIGLGQGMPLALRGLAGYLIGNQIVNYVLTPRFQSRSLQLHPFLVILAALAGASLGGALGAFLALPGAAVLQTVLKRMWGPQARPEDGVPAPKAPTPSRSS